MRFRVDNLGPLRRAEVDLTKDLIVFAGPNNTGKTYLAWAIYGFERFEPRQELPSLTPILDALLAAPDQPVSLVELLERGDFAHELAASFTENIADEYAGQPDHFREATVSITPAAPIRLRAQSHGVFLSTGDALVSCQIADDQTVRLTASPPSRSASAATAVSSTLIDASLRPALRKLPVRFLHHALSRALRSRHKTVVFPVERLAINTFAKELTERRTELIDTLRGLADRGEDAALAHELTRQVERYPRAIRDALLDATRLDAYRRSTSPLADIADELESTILGGRITLNEDNVLEFTPDRAHSTHLRIQQSASVVKSLASLVFHLRHRARPDERLIIDEPELNLHPDNQRKVARVLAKLVNRGVQLIISTHSDYFIRELNNLIMLSQPSDAARQLADQLGLEPAMLLTPDRLGVYLFRVDGACEAVPVTETGFAVETIDDEVHRLNLDAQTIYACLFLDE
jgi:hypothetical protein